MVVFLRMKLGLPATRRASRPAPRTPGHALRARLHERGGARHLADVEAVVVPSDEQLQLGPARCRRHLGLGHRPSIVEPGGLQPQRVTSATRSPDCRSRSMKTCTSAWKNAAAARGLSSVSGTAPRDRGPGAWRRSRPARWPSAASGRTGSSRRRTRRGPSGQHLLDTLLDGLGDDDRAAHDDEHLLADLALVEEDLAPPEHALAQGEPEGGQPGGSMSLNSRTSRRKASVSAGLATGVPVGLRGHATDESAPELLGARGGRPFAAGPGHRGWCDARRRSTRTGPGRSRATAADRRGSRDRS